MTSLAGGNSSRPSAHRLEKLGEVKISSENIFFFYVIMAFTQDEFKGAIAYCAANFENASITIGLQTYF